MIFVSLSLSVVCSFNVKLCCRVKWNELTVVKKRLCLEVLRHDGLFARGNVRQMTVKVTSKIEV